MATLGSRFWNIAAIIGAIWTTSILGILYPEFTDRLALIPRDVGQWWGIFTIIFVHQDVQHLLANSPPLILFLILLKMHGERVFFLALIINAMAGGLLLWIFGRTAMHIGASGLVFALFGFLISNAIVTRHFRDIAIALVVIVSYWGLVVGLLPTDLTTSWDGHLCGLLGGVLTSALLSKQSNLQSRL